MTLVGNMSGTGLYTVVVKTDDGKSYSFERATYNRAEADARHIIAHGYESRDGRVTMFYPIDRVLNVTVTENDIK